LEGPYLMSRNQILSLIHENQDSSDLRSRVFPETTWVQSHGTKGTPTNHTFISPVAIKDMLNDSKILEEKILSYLSCQLNEFHNVSLSKNAWEIIIGHWIRAYSRLIIKHLLLIQKTISEKNPVFSEVHIRDINHKLEIPYDTEEAFKSFETFDLIEHICAIIFKELSEPNTNVICFSRETSQKRKLPTRLPYEANLREKCISKLEDLFSSYAKIFSRKNDAMIVSSYLPFYYEFLLNLRLNQWPRFRMPSNVSPKKKSNPDISVRGELFKCTKFDNLEMKIAKLLLGESLPIVFLEGFHEVTRSIDFLRLPSDPRFIFTSNSFMTDEIFKQYTAFHVDRGVPYFVGQHGNNYGTLLEINPTIEEQTSTTFLSWGWTSENTLPAFILKNPRPRIRKKSNSLENLLFVTGARNSITSLRDVQKELDQNLSRQETLIKKIDKEIRDALVIRMHPDALLTGERNILSSKSILEKSAFNYGNTNINPLINRSRIVIHAYDSTGILETLSRNIPTIGFWHKESSPKTESADAYYRILEEVGIIHYDGESAANFINSNWANIDDWWLSQRVQNARMLFCNEYARTNRHPVGYLLRILKPR